MPYGSVKVDSIVTSTQTVTVDNLLNSATAASTYLTKVNPSVNGSYRSNIVAVSQLFVDCSSGNYFTKSISGNSTFTFSNVPSSASYSFTLSVLHTGGSISWPGSVQWPKNTAPTLTSNKYHLFMFSTHDGGSKFYGAALVDYNS